MPATFTSSGTWTTLNMDLSQSRMTNQALATNNTASLNVPQVLNLNAGDFATTGRINVVPEIFEMIQLFQKGIKDASGGTNFVSFWTSAAFIRAQLNALFSGQASSDPSLTSAYNTTL